MMLFRYNLQEGPSMAHLRGLRYAVGIKKLSAWHPTREDPIGKRRVIVRYLRSIGSDHAYWHIKDKLAGPKSHKEFQVAPGLLG